jgi:hypothetical protein
LAEPRPEHLVLCVEEKNRKPTWEAKKQNFIFVLEDVAGTTHFRVLEVGSADEAKVRRLKDAGQLDDEELQKILDPTPIQ